jgi:hypothetical protein
MNDLEKLRSNFFLILLGVAGLAPLRGVAEDLLRAVGTPQVF